MLARRLPGLLPPLTPHEAIEVTRLHSVGGTARRQRADRAAAVPRAASHDLGVRPRRRRPATDARRGDARPPRRAVPRRAVGVHAAGARGAAPAARGRQRHDRPGAARDGLPDARHARGGVEPVPVRAGGGRLPVQRGRPGAPPAAAQRSAARPDRRVGDGRPPVGDRTADPGSAAVGGAAAADPRGARSADGAARRDRADVQRAADGAAAPRAGTRRRRQRSGCSTSSTIATTSRRAATGGSCASRGLWPISTAPTRCSPTTSSAPRRSGSTTRRSRSRHERVRRMPAAERADRRGRRAARRRMAAPLGAVGRPLAAGSRRWPRSTRAGGPRRATRASRRSPRGRRSLPPG